MKKTIALLLYSFFTTLALAQEPAIEWQKCFGGTNRDFSTSIQSTADGGYIMVGQTRSNDNDVVGYHGGG